jgi:hypothetical protein
MGATNQTEMESWMKALTCVRLIGGNNRYGGFFRFESFGWMKLKKFEVNSCEFF